MTATYKQASPRQRRQRMFMALMRQIRGAEANARGAACAASEWPELASELRKAAAHIALAVNMHNDLFRAEFPAKRE